MWYYTVLHSTWFVPVINTCSCPIVKCYQYVSPLSPKLGRTRDIDTIVWPWRSIVSCDTLNICVECHVTVAQYLFLWRLWINEGPSHVPIETLWLIVTLTFYTLQRYLRSTDFLLIVIVCCFRSVRPDKFLLLVVTCCYTHYS